jgi:hypothetical protein
MKPTLKEHIHMHCRRQPIFIPDQMFELPTQRSSIVLEIAIVRDIILMKEDDSNNDWEISGNENEDLRRSTLSSDIKEDDLDIQQQVPHLDQMCHDNTIQTSRVPPPKKWSRVDTVIARTSLPNL